MDAFDADVIIYAASRDHPLGRRVAILLPRPSALAVGASRSIGSLLLLPEVLSQPMRRGVETDVARLAMLLRRLDLRPLDRATAEAAASLGAAYGLRAADATHLATAVIAGADRFITNNRKDFPQTIEEVAVTYPGDLPPTGD